METALVFWARGEIEWWQCPAFRLWHGLGKILLLLSAKVFLGVSSGLFGEKGVEPLTGRLGVNGHSMNRRGLVHHGAVQGRSRTGRGLAVALVLAVVGVCVVGVRVVGVRVVGVCVLTLTLTAGLGGGRFFLG